MSELRITIASRDDVPALIALREQWRSGDDQATPADAAFTASFTAWFDAEAKQRTFWLARRDDRPIGMANLVRFTRMPVPGRASGGWGYLGNMFVTADERNNGVGTRLLAAVLDHADAAGLERVVLHPTDRSIPFYRRAGFGDANELLLRPRRELS